MKQLIRNIIVLICIFLQSEVGAQNNLNVDEIEKGVDKHLTYFSNENPGAVVSVIKKGDLIFNKAYGLSNVQNQHVMTEDMLFNLGELSKSFTAIAILKLVEKNKLSLDDNLNNIFLDFPEYGKDVTIEHILNHKSGLASYDATLVKSNIEIYEFIKKQDKAVFEPGSKFIYSNADYPLLALIIEKKSGISYKEFIRKNLFGKLGMNDTRFVDEINKQNIAESHFKDNDEYVVEKKEDYIYGEQGIYTNSADYAKYDKALYTNKLLKCESLHDIFKIGKLTQGENKSDYACGWALMAKGGVRYFWQGAGSGGYTNLVLHLPDTQTTVLILTNRNDGYDFLKMAIYIAKLFDKDLKL